MNIIARRGVVTKNVPMNSLDAINLALHTEGVSGVSVDFRMTKDFEIVAFKEKTIDSMLDGRGNVGDFTLDELRRFHIGSKVHRQRVATLQEVLNLFHSNEMLVINLQDEGNRNSTFIRRVAEILRQYHDLNLWITSYNREIVLLLKDLVDCDGAKIGKNLKDEEGYECTIETDFACYPSDCLKKEVLVSENNQNHGVMICPVNTEEMLSNLEGEYKDMLPDMYLITDNVMAISNYLD